MKAKILLLILLQASATVFQSCNKRNPAPVKDELKVPRIESILNGNDQSLINLLNKVRGSVGRRGPGSKTVWSRKNDFELGLYISANHIYGVSAWASRNAAFFDLSTENPGIFMSSQLPPADGNITLGNTWIADFPLAHFNISSTATNTTILPDEDFYLGMIDNQRAEQGPLAIYPKIVQKNTPLQMYDPENRTKSDQTWNHPVGGQHALAVGYPQDRSKYPNGAVAYGKILADSEVATVMAQLKAAGDSEGDIPYNPNVEFLMKARALPGMSGGGVFNTEGQLLGIMVRASDHDQAPEMIRVVKISHIKLKMNAFYNSLSEMNKSKILPFISGEL